MANGSIAESILEKFDKSLTQFEEWIRYIDSVKVQLSNYLANLLDKARKGKYKFSFDKKRFKKFKKSKRFNKISENNVSMFLLGLQAFADNISVIDSKSSQVKYLSSYALTKSFLKKNEKLINDLKKFQVGLNETKDIEKYLKENEPLIKRLKSQNKIPEILKEKINAITKSIEEIRFNPKNRNRNLNILKQNVSNFLNSSKLNIKSVLKKSPSTFAKIFYAYQAISPFLAKDNNEIKYPSLGIFSFFLNKDTEKFHLLSVSYKNPLKEKKSFIPIVYKFYDIYLKEKLDSEEYKKLKESKLGSSELFFFKKVKILKTILNSLKSKNITIKSKIKEIINSNNTYENKWKNIKKILNDNENKDFKNKVYQKVREQFYSIYKKIKNRLMAGDIEKTYKDKGFGSLVDMGFKEEHLGKMVEIISEFVPKGEGGSPYRKVKMLMAFMARGGYKIIDIPRLLGNKEISATIFGLKHNFEKKYRIDEKTKKDYNLGIKSYEKTNNEEKLVRFLMKQIQDNLKIIASLDSQLHNLKENDKKEDN